MNFTMEKYLLVTSDGNGNIGVLKCDDLNHLNDEQLNRLKQLISDEYGDSVKIYDVSYNSTNGITINCHDDDIDNISVYLNETWIY